MKLYRHYKNKPYKYLGEAKHSETLEDLVLYECLYPNETSRLWVRPKAMFEGTVNGQPRFAKIEPLIAVHFPVSEAQINEVDLLSRAIFTDWDSAAVRSSLKAKADLMIVTGSVDDKLVGYKLGYRSTVDPESFYSMLGGILPDYRGVGLAEDLMRAQHEWAKEQGYKKLRTSTMNCFRAMLTLNIKSGFDITGAELDKKDGRFKIQMEKTL